MVRAVFPLFVRVTVVAVDVTVVAWFANAKGRGEKVTSGASPVPVRLTDCGLVLAESVKVRLAEKLEGLAEAVVGAKVTFTTQLPFIANCVVVEHVV